MADCSEGFITTVLPVASAATLIPVRMASGKFQGATIVAAMWLLVIMAGLADTPPISRTWLRVGLVAGPLVFIAIGLAGAVTAGAFLAYPEGYAKPLIIVIELALMPTLALILALLIAGAPRRPVRP